MHVYAEGSQTRLAMRRRRQLQLMGYSQDNGVSGGVSAAEIDAASNPGIGRPILIGVCTGVSVWLATRILDRIFSIERRAK